MALCSPVVAEASYGAYKILVRDKSRRYLDALNYVMAEVLINPVLLFDVEASFVFGRIKAEFEAKGTSRDRLDLMIAAICIANGATLATRNARDFSGLDVKLINPFEAA